MDARITIDGTAALAQGGGIGRLTRGLLTGLAACDQETPFTLARLADAQGSLPRLPGNFRWRTVPLTQRQAVWLWHRLRLPLPITLWTGRADLYHSPDYTLPPRLGGRAVVTVHDLSYEAMPEVHLRRLRTYLQAAVPRAIRQADHVFADSRSTREQIIHYYGTDAAKVSVIYPGVEARFRPLDGAVAADRAALDGVRAAYDLPDRFLLTLGTLEPRKNQITALRAAARVIRESEPTLTLVIAGGGGWLGQREALEREVAALGVEGRVQFTGFVDDRHLPALINLAEILLYPSLYEGFGLPVLEALACGTPVVTARNTSLPEAGGRAARYIADPLDDQALAVEIQRLLSDPDARESARSAGLAHAADFTWIHTARAVLDGYRRVLDG